MKETLSIAWPAVLESFLVSITNFVDSLMVSSMGATAIAAIGLTTQPKFLMLCFFLATNVAVSAIVARRRGEKNRDGAVRVLRTALIFTIVLTLILSSFFILIDDFIIDLAGSRPETHELAVEYFDIIIIGMIFNTIMLCINAAQRGAGNTKIAMTTNMTSNVVNVIFNYLLIGGHFGFPALGVKGAAIATVIGTMFGCTIGIFSVFNKKSFVYFRGVKGWLADSFSIKSMFSVGMSSFVEQVFLRIGFFLFALTVANLGTTEFAAHQVGMNFMHLSFSFADGLQVASVALVGRSLGQSRRDMARLYSSACQRLGLLCAFVISLVFLFLGRPMFSLFSKDPVILDYGVMMLRVLCVAIYMQIQQVVILGSLRGAGDTKYTAMVSLICVTFIRPGFSWLLCYPCGLGLLSVWLGTFADQIARFTFGWIRFKKGDWLNIRI
ncbi:MAG: MATE family efflux transporter [Clostridia bacterium]|nr:MATE family efflux transporter [Clostridia bacterium]